MQVYFPCQGNKFYVGNPEGVKIPSLACLINKKSSDTLPMCEKVTDKTSQQIIEMVLKQSGVSHFKFMQISPVGKP